MFTIYRKSLGYWYTALPVLLILAAILVGLELWAAASGRNISSTANSGAMIFIIYFFHRHFLFHEAPLTLRPDPSHKVKRPIWLFFLVSLALALLPAIATGVIATSLAQNRDQILGAFLLVGCPIYLGVFSLFATALPASIDRDPRYSLAAALRQAPRMAGLVLAGPVLTGILLLALFIATTRFFPAAESTPVRAFLVGTVQQTAGFLTSILAAATFCHVYRRIVPEHPAPPEPTA